MFDTTAEPVAPVNVGLPKVTTGTSVYPSPEERTTALLTPCLKDSIPTVAAAPTPPPPLIVTVGGSLYPSPASVNTISFMDLAPPIEVVIATAVAVLPLIGAENVTVGVEL